MEQYKKKAESILNSITSYAPFKEMNGIPRQWFIECIEKGLQEVAQPPSAPAVEEDVDDWRDAKMFTNEEILEMLADFTTGYKKSMVKDLTNDAAEYLSDKSKGRPYQAASATQGAVWVKASEYKPKLETEYKPYRKLIQSHEKEYQYGEIYITKDEGSIFFDINGERIYDPNDNERWKDCEILNESTPSKEVAMNDFLGWTYDKGLCTSGEIDKLKQLYDLFKSK